MKIKKRDIEKVYTKGEFIKKLRRLADFLEKNNLDSGDFIWGMVQTMMRELE